MDEEIWLSDPSVLFNCNVLPKEGMTHTQKMNALTRLLLIITIVLYYLGYGQWTTVLAGGLLLVLALHKYGPRVGMGGGEVENFRPEITEAAALASGVRGFVPGWDSKPHVRNPTRDACWFNANQDLINAKYEIITPIQFNHDDAAKRSYMNAKYELTPLTDTDGFKQIWRSEPEMCGSYTMIPDATTVFPVEDNDNTQGQCNYIVRSKIDHLPQTHSGLQSTRAMAEFDYTKSMLDFRQGIMNDHIDRFRRERQHNCPDMKLGSVSAGAGGSI